MKKLVLIVCSLFLLSGCMTLKKVCCPSEDIFFMTTDGIPVSISKGFFDKEFKGSNWLPLGEYKLWKEKQKPMPQHKWY